MLCPLTLVCDAPCSLFSTVQLTVPLLVFDAEFYCRCGVRAVLLRQHRVCHRPLLLI